VKNPILVGGLFIVCLGILMIACQAPAPTGLTDQDRAAIRKASEDMQKMINAPERDYQAIVEFHYTEDPMSLAPNEPAMQGRAGQIAWYKNEVPSLISFREEIVELDGRGDLAFARLTGTLKFAMPGAPSPVVDTIKGMEIWKKQKEGSWKVCRDIWNSDLPRPW